jgi:hypothetical protein
VVAAESVRAELVVVALVDLDGLTSLLLFLDCVVISLVEGPALGYGRTGELSREGFGELVAEDGCDVNSFFAMDDDEGCWLNLGFVEVDEDPDSFVDINELTSVGSSTSGTPAME